MTEALPPPMALFRMASGFYVSRAIYVAAKLGNSPAASSRRSPARMRRRCAAYCACWLASRCSPKRRMAGSP